MLIVVKELQPLNVSPYIAQASELYINVNSDVNITAGSLKAYISYSIATIS